MAPKKLLSWIESANSSTTHFSLYNLPFGVFQHSSNTQPHIGVAIGDSILDCYLAVQYNVLNTLSNTITTALQSTQLNEFMNLTPADWKNTRNTIQLLLQSDSYIATNTELQQKLLVKQSDVTMLLPCKIGNYTDFYSSIHHATNVGIMFRGKDNALPANWKHLPIAYHGRASSVVPSGTDLHRPHGQITSGTGSVFSECKNLDFELEVGFLIGNKGNQLGQPIALEQAPQYIFGYVLVNDWSARDIQRFEYVPLGPFGAKNFGTSISCWVVTVDALHDFSVNIAQQQSEPTPLPYLTGTDKSVINTYDIKLDVLLQSEQMRQQNISAQIISQSNIKHLYWSFTQQLVHHTITGCNMTTGDLLASGTISGDTDDSLGSMLELCWNRTKTIELQHTNEQRQFLENHDKIVMTGYQYNKELDYTIGFGTVEGIILPAVKLPYQ